MPVEKISISTARNMLLAAQGLAQSFKGPAAKTDVLAAIRRMAVLQIDTISVVARSPYLVLWSRLGDYKLAWLDELLAEGALFEYWAHAMCFVPVEDFPLFRRQMLERVDGRGNAAKWLNEHSALVARVLERIRQEGGLRSANFITEQKTAGGWWNWKEEKIALEYLFFLGELMIARRQGFQRVYDLRARVLPGWEDGEDEANVPRREAVLLAHTLRAVETLGVALADWVPDYFRLPKTGNASRLEALANAGLIEQVEIEGLPGKAYRKPGGGAMEPVEVTTLLSPFDPIVWDRKRLKDLFGFDYKIETYTPIAKRPFGYFTLPILHRGALVGRLDPKAHRKDGLFEVKAIALEPGVEPCDDLVAGLGAALRRLAAWHGTPEVVIRRSEPADLAKLLIP